jgi:DNA polymerase-3 subunit gamma/tau
MYQVIARKYRPQSFGELISQEHVKTTLENAINQRRIAHGYIFSGQRGTGKTSVARIFARCLNCIQGPTANPCGVCASCTEIAAGSAIDVIEIDAASNRGINEMRELRESVRFRPARDRYKVFIVDEAHQITSEAFNALLKTLEEPPEWVVFILCTTESHKIPATIQSRCQQFSFRSVDFAELMARMEWIAQQEGIVADAEVLSVLAQAGEGSVRDSLSALDQAIACCGNTLNAAEVRSLLGMFSLDSLAEVAKALAAGDAQRMFEIVAELEANGRSLQHFSRELARYIRNLLVVRLAKVPTRLVAASAPEQERLAEAGSPFSEEDLTRYLQLTLDLFRDLQSSLQPRFHLEMGLLRMVHAGRLQSIEEALAEIGGEAVGTGSGSRGQEVAGFKATPRPAPTSQFAAKSAQEPATSTAPLQPVAVPPVASVSAAMAPGSGDFRSRLHAALVEAKLTHVADAVEHSEVVESPNEIVITTPKMYQMYLKPQDLEATVARVAGRAVRITIKVGESMHVTAPVVAPVTAPGAAGARSTAPTIPTTPAAALPGDEATARALENPEVQRFREAFPDSQVRMVRNLKDRS